jgi:FOG: PKD repeat
MSSAGKIMKPDASLDIFFRVGFEPHLVVFTDISYKGGEPTWKVWNFGDGTYSRSMGKKEIHIYQKPGKYYVSLKTGNSAGFDMDKDIVKVYKYPLPG